MRNRNIAEYQKPCIMDQKLSLLILREVGEVLSHVHKICTCLYPCSSLVHGDILQGGTSATQ